MRAMVDVRQERCLSPARPSSTTALIGEDGRGEGERRNETSGVTDFLGGEDESGESRTSTTQ